MAAVNDFIAINPNAPQAQMLLMAIRTLRAAQDQLAQSLDKMTHLNNGTDFTPLETQFGVPSGKGQVVFDLCNGAMGSMKGTFQTPDATTITQKVG